MIYPGYKPQGFAGPAFESGGEDPHSLVSGVAAFWPLNGSLAEASGEASALSITGDVESYVSGPGGTGSAFATSGAGYLHRTGVLVGSGDFTISGFYGGHEWSGGETDFIFGQRTGTAATGPIKIGFRLDRTTTEEVSAFQGIVDTTAFPDPTVDSGGGWTHMVLTYTASESTARLYLNGVLAATLVEGANFTGLTGFLISRSSGNGIVGRYSFIGVWGRVITSQEITDLYNGGFGFNPFA